MKRDYTTISDRIKEKGLTKIHVAKKCKMAASTLARIMGGDERYQNPEKIEAIHKYLDTVKT